MTRDTHGEHLIAMIRAYRPKFVVPETWRDKSDEEMRQALEDYLQAMEDTRAATREMAEQAGRGWCWE